MVPRFDSFIIDIDLIAALSGFFPRALFFDSTRGRSRVSDLLLYSFSLARDPCRIVDLARPILSRSLSGDLDVARLLFSLSLSSCISGFSTTFSFARSLRISPPVLVSSFFRVTSSFSGIPVLTWGFSVFLDSDPELIFPAVSVPCLFSSSASTTWFLYTDLSFGGFPVL